MGVTVEAAKENVKKKNQENTEDNMRKSDSIRRGRN